MEIIFILTSILQSIGVALGVGSSTLAITNFFVAIADGKIDENERSMMGVVYTVLRVAMVLILLTTTVLSIFGYMNTGWNYFTPFVVSFWVLTGVLYTNAILMTKHMIPSTVGPALQASSWYTLGTLMALYSLGLTNFTFLHFALGYLTTIFLAVSLVNGFMAELKGRRNQKAAQQ